MAEDEQQAAAAQASDKTPADAGGQAPLAPGKEAEPGAKKTGAETVTAADAAAAGEQADADDKQVVRNEDGSITIAESEAPTPTKKQARRWVGRGIRPDVRYGSELVSKFVNCIMLDGKKSLAERIVYQALEQIADKLRVDPLNVFEQALDNARPRVEVRSKRVGGANYQVPVEVKPGRAQTLAIRWILEAARGRKGRPMVERLSQELIDCYNKTGTTIQRRENTHRMAEANKAFAHFS